MVVILAIGLSNRAIAFGPDLFSRGYIKVSEVSCETTGRLLSNAQLIKTLDGGYAFSAHTQIDAGFIKVTGSGQLEWSTVWGKPNSKQIAQGLSQLDDGGYLLLGRSDSYEQALGTWGAAVKSRTDDQINYPLILKFAKDKVSQSYGIRNGPLGIERSSISRAVQVSDGVIFFGLKRVPISDGGEIYNYSPWIFKVRLDGVMAWEYLIKSDDGGLIKDVNEVYGSFSKPIVDDDGGVIVATQVSRLKESNGVVQKYSVEIAGENPRLLVVKLASNGSEVARYRNYQSGGGVLAKNSDGIHVFASSGVGDQSRVMHFVLSKDLRVIKENAIAMDEFRPRAVVAGDRTGEFHLFGIATDTWGGAGVATLAYLDVAGRVKNKTSLGQGTWPSDMVPGAGMDEVAIVYSRADRGSGVIFSRYRVKH